MTKVRGTVRTWHADEGWGVFDSEQAPSGCRADARDMMPMDPPPNLQAGDPVRFDWTDSGDESINGFRLRAFAWYPVDESLDLDDEDYDRLDLEEPTIDDDAPVTVEDFVRDSRRGSDPDAVPQLLSNESAYSIGPAAADDHAGYDFVAEIVVDDSPEPEPLTGEFAILEDVGGARQLIEYNADLVARILAMPPAEQRRLARWCVNRAYERAGLHELGWVAPALDAFNHGETELPDPFGDLTSASARWQAEGYPTSMAHVREAVPLSARSPFRNDQRSLAYSALPTIFRALQSSALAAAESSERNTDMTISRDDARWPEAVHRATGKVLREGARGLGHRTRVIATWLDGPWLNIVYARKGTDIYYGFRCDTYRGMTGTDWPEPEAIGFEIAAFGVFEPHGTSHPIAATQPLSTIHWIGHEQPRSVSDLNDIPKDALWTNNIE